MSNIFDEVDRQLNGPRRGPPLLFRIIFGLAATFIAAIFVLIVYSFFNPEPLAKLQGRALGTMMREAERAYNEE